MHLRRHPHTLFLLLALCCSFSTAACRTATAHRSTDQPLLNSERIERRFGSYGIEVLKSTPRVRVSNLYSGHGSSKICRTLAVVLYPEQPDPRLTTEHQLIVDGGSIGATFKRRGWSVSKRHLHYGAIDPAPAAPRLERLMGIPPTESLALHIYALAVSRRGIAVDYATIAEIHHPDYLSPADLQPIYGEKPSPPVPANTLEWLLSVVRSEI